MSMGERRSAVLGIFLGGLMTAFGIWSAGAEPLGARPRLRFDKPWQKKAPPLAVAGREPEYDERTYIAPVTLRLHQAADGYVLFAQPVSADEEERLVRQGFRRVERAAAVRHRAIFAHEAYVAYKVGIGGPSDEELARAQGAEVKARFKSYRGMGAPMLIELRRSL